MIDHMGIPVSDIGQSRRFYEATLGALDMTVNMEIGPERSGDGSTSLAFGANGDKIFWISDGSDVGKGLHVAFKAERREQVDRFHEAALKAGGRDNGKPGPRPNYGPNYYAAFVYDPDGANIEAVCYAAE